MKKRTSQIWGLLALAGLALVTACETSDPKSSEANITQLTLTVGGEDKTVTFNNKREATVLYEYASGKDAPTTVIVKSISLSNKATATVTSAGTLAITNNKASITVTAEDGSKLVYTISFTFTEQPRNTEKEITALTLEVGGQEKTVTFDEAYQATVEHQYPFGEEPPTTATVQGISTSENATASVAQGETLTIADNKATITVTAQDASTQDYTITFNFTQALDTNVDITNLVLTVGGEEKTVTFDEARQATVEHQYPFGEEPPTTATVRGISTSENATASVAQGETLTIADNKASITVTAQDNTEETYTINFNFTQTTPSSEKEIATLTLALGGEDKAITFDDAYQATVAHQYSIGEEAPTTVTVQRINTSENATASVVQWETLTIVDNKVTITVTAQDASTQDYTVTFSFTQVDGNTLKAITKLVITLGGEPETVAFNNENVATIAKEFPFGTTLPTTFTVTEITVSPQANTTVSNNATITIADNQATITVTAQDGSTQTYTLNFTLTIAPNTAAAITTLVLTVGGEDKTVAFDDAYQATVEHQYPFGEEAPTTATVQGISTSADAVASVAQGETLTIADNKATITVTAQDGTTTQTYTIAFTFTQAPNTATAITKLVLTLGGEDKTVTFNENGEGAVAHQVPFGTAFPTQATVKEIALSQAAKATVANNETLPIGEDNTTTITVTAQDGTTTQTYTVVFTFTQVLNTAAEITTLVLTVGEEDKTVAFDENRRDTIAHQFPFGTASPTQATVREIALSQEATATVASNGTLAIAENNTATITVTAQDGTTTQTYTIVFTFTQALNTAAEITTLVLTVGEEDKTVVFNEDHRDTVAYQFPFGSTPPTQATVNEIALSQEAIATVASNGTLPIGEDNTTTITVTAQDGTVQTYTLFFEFTALNLATAPSAPALFLAVGVAPQTEIAITLTASANAGLENDGAPASITGYRVTYADNPEFTNALTDNFGTTLTGKIQGLSPGTTYLVYASASNSAGQTSAGSDTLRLTTAANPTDLTLSGIVASGSVPTDLSAYSEAARAVLAPYTGGATVAAKYTTSVGAGTKDGSSWNNAAPAERIALLVSGINDASSDKIYLILAAAGNYDAMGSINMKNNVAIVGGWGSIGGWKIVETDTTVFTGEDRNIVFRNTFLNSTAVLYGVKIANGSGEGGGMFNDVSSPTLTNVTFSGNSAGSSFGGAMFNQRSHPTLTNVTFSGNSAGTGGGMYNATSHPTLTNVTFSGNTATNSGGGMHNIGAYPTLTNVTFSGNSAPNGGGMYNGQNGSNPSPSLTNVTFSGNSASNGGGMYNDQSRPTLANVTFFGNSAANGGGMHNVNFSYPVVVNSIFWGNTASGDGAQITVWDRAIATIHSSVLQGDTTAIGRDSNGTFYARSIVTTDPFGSNTLADNGGRVRTVAISSGSTAQNIGLYVQRGSDGTFYYSEDKSTWYLRITAGELAGTSTPPADAVDLTAADATGTARSGRPDAGAYEAR